MPFHIGFLDSELNDDESNEIKEAYDYLAKNKEKINNVKSNKFSIGIKKISYIIDTRQEKIF